MSRPSLAVVAALLVSIAGPAHSRPPAPTPLIGRLVEARCYFETGAIADHHTYCAFRSAQANLPLGVLTDDGRFVYLAHVPSTLADHVTRRVKARARTTADAQFATLVTLSIWRDAAWRPVKLR